MANDLTKTLTTGFRRFHQNVRSFTSSWTKLTSAESESNPQLDEAEIFGLTPYVAQADSPTPQDVKSASHVTATAAFERTVKFSLKQVRDNPRLVENTLATLGRLGGLTLTRAFWTAVKAVASTAHPYSGTAYVGPSGAGSGGGTVYIADEHKWFPPNVTAFEQANLLGVSFGAPGLKTAIDQRLGFYDVSGNELAYENEEKPFLIVPGTYLQTAHDLMKQMGLIYDGSGLQSGSFQERAEGVVQIPGPSTTTNWGLWWRTRVIDTNGQAHFIGPIRPWLRFPPRLTFAEAESSHHIICKAEMEYAIVYSLDAHLNLVWSAP